MGRRRLAAASPIAIPASRAQPSSIFASGTTTATPEVTPAYTSPVEPSIEMTSPAESVRSPIRTSPSPGTTSAAPTTAGLPQPRATTAAWLANPPVAVRIPRARSIPAMSSGDVSGRTRITSAPPSAAATASADVSRISPDTSPGETPSPRVSAGPVSPRSTTVVGGSASTSATRRTASSRVRGNAGSSAMSTAIRSAAWGVRLPTRTWSIHSRPRSMVNSMSQQSR